MLERRPRLADGTLGDLEKVGSGETPEEKVTRLEQEKDLLMSTLMEMSVYMAGQESRLTGQESAIMELSMLVAMSSMGGGETDV